MTIPLRSLIDPPPDRLDFVVCERLTIVGHAVRLDFSRDSLVQKALFSASWNYDRATEFGPIREKPLGRIQSEVPTAPVVSRPVTREAVLRQDRTNFSGEVDGRVGIGHLLRGAGIPIQKTTEHQREDADGYNDFRQFALLTAADP